MASDSPIIDVLSEAFLGHLDRWCVAQIEKAGAERATLTLRATTVRALLRQARYGKGLATIQAKPFATLSEAGRHAANVRWARARAQRLATLQNGNAEKS
jgi:hypothetical protein